MRKSQSIWGPILIGTLAIVFAITILVGWSILFTHYYALYTRTKSPDLGVGYWFLLAVGCVFLVAIVTTLALLSIGNVRQILEVQQHHAFIDSVTHELKSPLASLRLCLETMEMRDLTPDMQGRFVGMMKHDVERLGAFVEHILEAGRLEHSERTLRYEPVSIARLVERCTQRVRKRHASRDPDIALTLPEGSDDVTLVTDETALGTILLNLIDNAVKYSPPPAQITVRVSASPRHTRICVQDRGVGLTLRQRKHVFRRFYRVKREGHQARGTGLGLYVVASLVQQLGGRIWVESEGEHQGSTFVVELPRLHDPSSQPT